MSSPDRDAYQATELVVVRVDDKINHLLAGHPGHSYMSPAQPREEALTLVRVLLGYTGEGADGENRWTCPVAGGRRTVRLEPATSPASGRRRGS